MWLDGAWARRGTAASLAFGLLAAGVLLTPHAAAQASTAQVDVRGNAFIPSSITVLVGTTVTWTQSDAAEHTVTVDDNQPETWQQGILLPMNTAGLLNEFEHTFENLGTTKYHCEVHANMVGEVIVVESFDSPYATVNANDANAFSPELVEINATQGVLWLNPGSVPHTVTFEDESIGDLGELDPGQEIRFNFTAPGSYRYRCTYHSGTDFETGMVGKVVVGGNATFPTVLIIDDPPPNATLNSTFNVTGRLIIGEGQPDVTDLEYRIDATDDWTDINRTDLREFQWSFTVDPTRLEPGNHTIDVRALSNESEAAAASIPITIERARPPQVGDGANGIPVPSFVVVLGAVSAAMLALRRRNFR